MTWISPRLTTEAASSASIRSPAKLIEPLVTSPRSARSRLEIAFNVVVLPAPLPPSNATMPPSGTSSETPFSTRMTWLYMTSMLLTASSARASDMAGAPSLTLHQLRTVPRRDALFLRVLEGGLLVYLRQHVAVWLDPIRDGFP